MPEQTWEIFLSWDELGSGNRKKVNRMKIGQCREKSGQVKVRREQLLFLSQIFLSHFLRPLTKNKSNAQESKEGFPGRFFVRSIAHSRAERGAERGRKRPLQSRLWAADMPEQTEEIFLSWDELSSGNRKKVNRVKIGQCREKSGQNQVRREHSVANNSEFSGIICKFT